MQTRTLLARIERLEQAAPAQSRFSPDCICFPANEQPEFKWRVEAEVAAKVLCPLHGLRFQVVVTRYLYRAVRFHIADFKWGWPDRSPQYQKAMRASFDLTVWPAQPVVWPPQEEHNPLDLDQATLILRDGTELASGGTAIDYRPGHEACAAAVVAGTEWGESDNAQEK